MNRPPLKTRIAGHPIIATPLTIAGLWSAYACWQNVDALPAALGIGLLTAWSLEANNRMARYKAWKRAWDGLAPSRAPQRRSVNWRPWGGAALIAATFLYVAAHADQPGYSFALGWMLIGFAVMGIVLTAKRLRRGRAKATGTDLAMVVIRRPLLPVPSLEDAYRRLPPYCQQLLERGR